MGFERRGEQFVLLHLRAGGRSSSTASWPGIGIEPNVELAQQAG